jgi:DNA-binding MarR family transcriptional regulator
MSGFNDIIHQAMRLRIMAALNVLPAEDAIVFPRLKGLVEATDGNLGAHLDALERAGYVEVEKRFEGKKPQTRIKATATGRRAFAEHVAHLREILDGAVPPERP